MTLSFYEIGETIREAEGSIRAVEKKIGHMLDLCVGRLRGNPHISGSTLSDLKRELRDFNATTHEWKKP